MQFSSQLDSTRFFYVQEALALGLFGAIAKTFFPSFPILELFGFVAPVVSVAFTVKTWENSKETASVAKTEDKKTDLAIAKVEDKKEPTDEEGDDELPIR